MAGCPFEVKFAAEKLDEIRIAVVEAFYAVPRGGIEIGGVLFGSRDGNALYVENYRLIHCEHRSGPSFLLSERDRDGLAALIADGPGEPLGWFLSHTRSEVVLSSADVEVHEKFFPEPWQVAMVLRPGNMQPVRAGYFFRDDAGRMRSDGHCGEFVVEPTFRKERKRPMPAMRSTSTTPAPEKPINTPVQKLRVQVAVAEAPEPEIPQPALASAEPADRAAHSGWKYVGVAAAFAAAALAVAAFVTRGAWMPASAAAPVLHLQASEVDGKLLLRWDPIRPADPKGGELTVEDGGKATLIALDPSQVSRGFYLYPRTSDTTIVHLQTGGNKDVATFTGPLPKTGPTPEEIEKAKQAAKVKEDLQAQTMRNRLLQRKVNELSKKLEAETP